MNIAIVGPRDYPANKLYRVEALVESLRGHTIVTGRGGNVDNCVESCALSLGMKVIIHPAEWGRYGKKAGPIRNALIAEDAEVVHAFGMGKTRGTADTVKKARALGKEVILHE